MSRKVAKIGRTPLSEMKRYHLNWNLRIAHLLNRENANTTVQAVGNWQNCKLGKWRSTMGQQYESPIKNHLLSRWFFYFTPLTNRQTC